MWLTKAINLQRHGRMSLFLHSRHKRRDTSQYVHYSCLMEGKVKAECTWKLTSKTRTHSSLLHIVKWKLNYLKKWLISIVVLTNNEKYRMTDTGRSQIFPWALHIPKWFNHSHRQMRSFLLSSTYKGVFSGINVSEPITHYYNEMHCTSVAFYYHHAFWLVSYNGLRTNTERLAKAKRSSVVCS